MMGSYPSSVLVKRKSRKVRMDPGRDRTVGFFQGWLLSVLLTSGALSDLVLIDKFDDDETEIKW